jgi:hypothetical protein
MADEYTVTIDGTFFDEDNMYGMKVVKGLNEMWSFEFMIIDPNPTQESKLVEGNTIRITYNGAEILKGTIRALAYTQESEEWHCTGYDKSIELFNLEEFDRTEWDALPASTIVTQLLSGRMNAGTIDTAPVISFRAEYGNVMERLHSIARAVGYDWYVDEDVGNNDQFNFVERLGSPTSTETFTIDEELIDLRTWKDHDRISNEINVLGWGDGDLQKRSYIHAGTTIRTNLNGVLTEGATTVTVDDTAGFPASGSVWVGMEKMAYTGKTATTFTGCTRGTDLTDGLKAYEHSDGLLVRDAANTAASPESGSSIDKYGRRQKSYPARDITDQDTLDRIAATVLLEFEEPPEIVEATLIASDLETAVLGDVATFGTQDFRITEIEYNQDEGLIFLKGGLTFGYLNEQIADLRKELTIQNQYAMGAPNYYQSVLDREVEQGFPLVVPFKIPSNAVSVGALELDLDLYKFRALSKDTASGGASTSGGGGGGSTAQNSTAGASPILTTSWQTTASFVTDSTDIAFICIAVNLATRDMTAADIDISCRAEIDSVYHPSANGISSPSYRHSHDYEKPANHRHRWAMFNSDISPGLAQFDFQTEGATGFAHNIGIHAEDFVDFYTWLNSGSQSAISDPAAAPTHNFFILIPGNNKSSTVKVQLKATANQFIDDEDITWWTIGQHTHTTPDHVHAIDFGIQEDLTTVLSSCRLELYLNGTKLTDTNCPALAGVTGWDAVNDWLTGYAEYSEIDISNQSVLLWAPGTRYELEVRSVNVAHNRCKLVARIGVDTFLKGKKTVEG